MIDPDAVDLNGPALRVQGEFCQTAQFEEIKIVLKHGIGSLPGKVFSGCPRWPAMPGPNWDHRFMSLSISGLITAVIPSINSDIRSGLNTVADRVAIRFMNCRRNTGFARRERSRNVDQGGLGNTGPSSLVIMERKSNPGRWPHAAKPASTSYRSHLPAPARGPGPPPDVVVGRPVRVRKVNLR